jgi:hypothetical protein
MPLSAGMIYCVAIFTMSYVFISSRKFTLMAEISSSFAGTPHESTIETEILYFESSVGTTVDTIRYTSISSKKFSLTANISSSVQACLARGRSA